MLKSVFILLFTAIFILMTTFTTLGAVHSQHSDYKYHQSDLNLDELTPLGAEEWFSIDREIPSFQIDALSFRTNQFDNAFLTLEEFRNDQMFGDLNLKNIVDTNKEEPDELYGALRISYLTNIGIFFGVDYRGSKNELEDEPVYSSVISAGYRLNLNNQGFLALSADYSAPVPEPYQLTGYDLDFKYFWGNFKTVVQLYKRINVQPIPEYDFFTDLEIDFKVNDALVLGGGLNKETGEAEEATNYFYGLTWKEPWFILNGKTGRNSTQENYYLLNGIIKIRENLHFGIEYYQPEKADDPKLTFQFTGKADNICFSLNYTPESNTWPQNWGLVYRIKPLDAGF